MMTRRVSLQFASALLLTMLSLFTAFAGRAGASDSGVTVAGEIELSAGWARAMLPGQPTGGGYITITNKGASPDRLLSVASPAAAMVEVHSMTMKDDVMVMRPVEGGLEIPAGATVELKPGGFHLMFMQVTEPFASGADVTVTLNFEKAGKIDVVLPVSATAP